MNKKILLVLLILAAAGLGYFALSASSNQDALPNIQTGSDLGSEATQINEEHHHDHDHEDHTHDHSHEGTNATSTNYQNVLGDLREATPLTINPAIGVRAIGNPNAPVKVTELFSLTCSHCATFHNTTYPLIKKNFVDTGKVYYVYQEFPLNAPALHASMIARCLPEERYSGFISVLFKSQEAWLSASDYKEPLRQNAKLAGMSDEEFDACLENKDIQEALAAVIQEASQKWEIKSTPSIVINDGERVITGAQAYPPMEHLLNAFLQRAANTNNEVKE
ncbi:MAG: DsbA family protein [Pseudomonadota bacterium]